MDPEDRHDPLPPPQAVCIAAILVLRGHLTLIGAGGSLDVNRKEDEIL